MNDQEKEAVRRSLKEALRLQNPEEVLFYPEEEGIFSFLQELPLEEAERQEVREDTNRLFPYAEGREPDFDAVIHVGRNIVFLDVLDLAKEKRPLSPLAVSQYEERLTKEREREGLEPSLEPWIFRHFHSLVEKLLFLEALRNERHLADKDVRFDLAEIAFLGEGEDATIPSRINAVERSVLSGFVEKMGTLEKGTDREARLVRIMR